MILIPRRPRSPRFHWTRSLSAAPTIIAESRLKRADRAALAAAFIFIFTLNASAAWGADTARLPDGVAVVERWHARLFAIESGAGAADALKAEMMATHDLAYMARLVLSRQWRNLDDADRARFIDAFTEFAAASYATRFGNINGLESRVTDARMTDRGNVEVRVALSPGDEPDVELAYLLRDVAGVLKIINVLADGVSELAIQRGEYRAVLAARGFEGLLAHLRERREALLNAS